MARELFRLFKFVERGDVSERAWERRDAIDAIYKQLTKRRDAADAGDLMVQLQRIVDSHVDVEKPDNKGTAQFDISKIDFGLLRREFEKAPCKNLLVNDLRAAIEQRLEIALRANPLRFNYFERYKRIIDEYNREQDRASIEATFEALIELTESLAEEERRYVREGFTNERQLAVFDMLHKDSLTKSEINQVKQLSRELVDAVQERLSHIERWTEKPETRADVKVLIRDELYLLLPESYPDESISFYRDQIYEYFYSRAA